MRYTDGYHGGRLCFPHARGDRPRRSLKLHNLCNFPHARGDRPFALSHSAMLRCVPSPGDRLDGASATVNLIVANLTKNPAIARNIQTASGSRNQMVAFEAFFAEAALTAPAIALEAIGPQLAPATAVRSHNHLT